jgi:flagellar biosynthesis GTPase FlhF
MLVMVASLEGTVVEVALAEVRLLSVAEGELVSEGERELVSETEADFQEVLKSDEAVTAETTSDEVTAVVIMLASMEVPLALAETMVKVALSMTELMVAGTLSVAELKEVDKPPSPMGLTGPTGVGRTLSVAELAMLEAVTVLMEVLKTPAEEPTELPQSVTVTVTVTASCEVAMAPMAAENMSVKL